MSTVKNVVAAAVIDELARAQQRFGPMNSGHEGWAVILEEAEELAEEVTTIHDRLPAVWLAVRADDVPSSRVLVEGIAAAAERAAVEAIQTAAMARRYLADLLGDQVPLDDTPVGQPVRGSQGGGA